MTHIAKLAAIRIVTALLIFAGFSASEARALPLDPLALLRAPSHELDPRDVPDSVYATLAKEFDLEDCAKREHLDTRSFARKNVAVTRFRLTNGHTGYAAIGARFCPCGNDGCPIVALAWNRATHRYDALLESSGRVQKFFDDGSAILLQQPGNYVCYYRFDGYRYVLTRWWQMFLGSGPRDIARPIRFASGSFSKTVDNSTDASEGQFLSLFAHAGQSMTVELRLLGIRISASSARASIDNISISADDGNLVRTRVLQNDAALQRVVTTLPRTGMYYITLNLRGLSTFRSLISIR